MNKIIFKVNDELKKLLVATMGDDLEIKMESLTRDKVKLAGDIVRYTAELTDEKEQLERMSIHSDMWRSKFLASRFTTSFILCSYHKKSQLRCKF